MTQTEALKLALEALEWNYNTDLDNIHACEKWAKMLKENIAAIREALASSVATNDTSQERVDETAKQRHEAAVRAERQRIVNLLMVQHEAAKGSHNYWHVAANLIKAESGENA